jgi:Na+-transporting methylmalonyl-CoA/oxaloacetate decarboxylase gamma subunit
MNALNVALSTYLVAIAFALLIALVIKGLAAAVEKLGLDLGEEDSDLSVPSANTLKEEEALAVAIAVAHAQHK